MKSHKHWKYFYELRVKEWFIMPAKVNGEGVGHIFMKLEINSSALDLFDASEAEVDPNEHVIQVVAGNMH